MQHESGAKNCHSCTFDHSGIDIGDDADICNNVLG
jgi:hypothetical protein